MEVPYIPKIMRDTLSIKNTYINYISENQKIFKPQKNQVIKKDVQQGYDKWFNEF